MYNIAICDDQASAIKSVLNALSRYQLVNANFTYQVYSYRSAEQLLSAYNSKQSFDILFLDIYMNGQDGLEAAQKLRDWNYRGQIVFITSSTAHALEAYQVDALQYLIKPIQEADFIRIMNRLLSQIYTIAPRAIFVRSGGEDYKVLTETITYTQANGHYQEIHLSNGDTLSIRGTFTALAEQLDEPYFTRIGKSYILNFQFVKNISSSTITLNDGTQLFPPRGSHQKVREEYFAYYQANENL